MSSGLPPAPFLGLLDLFQLAVSQSAFRHGGL
jgi:hypothetical protein